MLLVAPILLVPVTVVPHVPRKESVGTITAGLVTGSSILGVDRPVIWLTPKLPISNDPKGTPTGVPRFLDDDPVAVDVVAVMLEYDDAVEQVFNPVERTDSQTTIRSWTWFRSCLRR